MDAESSAELERLRVRAYGPAADIAGDPDAVRRLQELEALAAPPPIAVGTPDAAAGPDPVDPAAPASDPDPVPADLRDSAEPVDSPARRATRWPLVAAAWALSLLVAGGVVAAHTYVSTTAALLPVARGADAQQVAVLRSSTTVPIPRFLGSSNVEPRMFADFAGLTVLVSSGWREDPDDQCLLVLRTADFNPGADYVAGPLYTACGAGGFPASVAMRVTAEMPRQLRERFPVGSSLQFVLDGNRVGVFSDAVTDP